MAVTSPQRLHFEPDVVPLTPDSPDQACAVSSSTALARFEFESGRGNEGTKILMVEWEEDEDDKNNQGDWEVSWEGKSTTLSAKDGSEGGLHRLYFLLAPGANIPRIVKLAQAGGKKMQTNPLPAIFPAELGVTARTAGRKGVLHTIWAKKRLSVLQREIDAEMKTNGEGVGLEMALQEKQWIEDNFGVGSKMIPDAVSPGSPKSAGSGRLSEKLKGLKLGTSAAELSSVALEPSTNNHPLSPEQSDVAVSSFSLFHGTSSRPMPRAVAPPELIVAQQGDSRSSSRMNSLDAITGGHTPRKEENEPEDGLFMVKLSPRSPEMLKSPFSFTAQDTLPYSTRSS